MGIEIESQATTYEEVRARHAADGAADARGVERLISYAQVHADRAFLLSEVERAAALLTAMEAEAAGLRTEKLLAWLEGLLPALLARSSESEVKKTERVDRLVVLLEAALPALLERYPAVEPAPIAEARARVAEEVRTAETWQDRVRRLGLSVRTTGQLEELSPADRDRSLDQIEESVRETWQEKDEERRVARGSFAKDPRRDAWRSLPLHAREGMDRWLTDTLAPVPRAETRRALSALLAWESEVEWTMREMF